MASIISSGTTSGTALNFSGDTSGVLQLATNGTTTALSISTAQVVTLTNALPVTSGGTGVTTSTGTGAVVLGTSPTITTPTISSLSSASATALTLQSAGTNGVIIDTSQNLQFNSGYGSVATAYGCRAWVNFNGTGTVAIRASGNVSFITDLATGTYTVNLTTAIVDANYAIQISTGFASGIREDVFGVLYNDAPYTPTTTAYTIKFYRADTNVAVDSNYAMTSIFR